MLTVFVILGGVSFVVCSVAFVVGVREGVRDSWEEYQNEKEN
jgi:hypothetical protein